ncbi:MAG: LysE family translocator [Gemmobacter sp.]|nr:LysE family translocator [Gemmobacter sp.]
MPDLLTLVPFGQLLAFLAAGIMLNLTPGADVVFTTASGIAGGPKTGIAAGVGVGLGGLWHVTLAAAGVSALLAAHPGALMVLKWAGAGYLLWLAWKSWTAGAVMQPGHSSASALRALRRGFLTNAMNPKVALFVVALLPQFTDPARGPVWQQILVLGALFCCTGTVITCAYGAAAGFAGRALERRMGVMNKLSALLFGGLAARLVWE